MPGMAKAPVSSEIKPVYVLHGSDAFLLDAARKEILQAVVADADPQTCVASFEADAELAAVLDELRTLPFLAPRRLVIVRDADAFVAAHREALETYLQEPARHAALVLTVLSWPSNTRLAKLVAKCGAVSDCSAAGEAQVGRFIAQAAARRGKKVAPDAAELLADWIGADLAQLDNELEKLSLYVAAQETIVVADVTALVTATAGPASFALSNAITDQSAKAALDALAGMLTQRGDEFKTLGSIAWQVRRALAAQEKIAAGERAEYALPNMPSFQKAKFISLLKRRPLAKMQGDMRRLLKADLSMKSGGDPTAVLEELVIGLCT